MDDDRLTETAFAGWVIADDEDEDDPYGWLVHTGGADHIEGGPPSWVKGDMNHHKNPTQWGVPTIALKLIYEGGGRTGMSYMNIAPDEAVKLAGYLLRCAAACKRARGS
jgi:hypothetical protein